MGQFSQELVVENPRLWDIKQPNLYTAVSRLYEDGRLVDEYCTPFGIRTLEIRPDEGFFLNGREVKFKGVCLHHDLGPLGAAVNEAAIRRQIRTMQDMGANAIRTSHNMPAPEFVRIADEMGMMLMVESFDEMGHPEGEKWVQPLFQVVGGEGSGQPVAPLPEQSQCGDVVYRE